MFHLRCFQLSLFALFLSLFLSVPSRACTGLRVIAEDGAVTFARSLEFGSPTKSDIMIAPRGMEWTGTAPDGSNGLKWKSKYAFMGPDAFGQASPLEGMNEKGLYAAGFWMPAGESEFPKIAKEDYGRAVSQMDLGTWLLCNCATIDDVRKLVPALKLAGAKVPSLNMYTLVHWYVMDATGKAVVIESMGGKVSVTDNPVGVFTNAPSFGWHLENLRNYVSLRPDNAQPFKLGDYTVKPLGEGSGLLGLPGDQTPPSRFVRAAFYANTALKPADADGAVNLGMNLIANFTIPRGLSRGAGPNNRPEYDYTQWTTVYDLSRKELYFRTYENQDYSRVRLSAVPLDGDKPVFIPMWGVKPAYKDVSAQAKPQ
ncbi:linear amide C-N hydrolase [Pseudodesulfovibrio indicus]|uniref:linear amide C-N hydrolase n=1 Tax=Pseudodesulfovibrio indicus TaxID=1716143 RepID=UPI00292EA292|nr:linear amide C-N hydrolase [Pseudodesulfovibrio indicus]